MEKRQKKEYQRQVRLLRSRLPSLIGGSINMQTSGFVPRDLHETF